MFGLWSFLVHASDATMEFLSKMYMYMYACMCTESCFVRLFISMIRPYDTVNHMAGGDTGKF